MEKTMGTITKYADIITTGLSQADKLGQFNEVGLNEYLEATNITSMYLIDARCGGYDILGSLLKMNLRITASDIGKLFALKNTIDGIKVIDIIKSARLNATTQKESKSLLSRIFNKENFIELDDSGNIGVSNLSTLITIGSFGSKTQLHTKSDVIEGENQTVVLEDEETSEELLESPITALEAAGVTIIETKKSEIDNLAVGMDFSIDLKSTDGDDTKKQQVILSARLAPVEVLSEVVKGILALGSYRYSFKERYFSFKTNEITFTNFIALTDIRDKQAALLLKDNSGYYKEVLKRQAKNTGSSFARLIAGKDVESLKLIGGLVIDEVTMEEAEVEMGGSIEQVDIRNRIFAQTSAATLCVIRNSLNVVDIYYRGSGYTQTLSYSQIKKASNDSGTAEQILAMINRAGATRI